MMINWSAILEKMDMVNPRHQGAYQVAIYLRTNRDNLSVWEEAALREPLEKTVGAISRLKLDRTYGDYGYSGRIIRGRAALVKLLENAVAGKVDIVLTNSLTRLARDMSTLMEIADLLAEAPQVVGIVCEKEGLLLLSSEIKMWTENMARGVESSRHAHRVSLESYPTISMPL